MKSLPADSEQPQQSLEYLRSLEFFHGLGAAEIQTVARHFAERKLKREECLIRQGEPGDALYVLRSGQVEVRRYLSNGGHRRLAELPAGSIIGEMELLSGRSYYATVVATEPVVALVLDRDVFHIGLDSNEPWANKLLRHLTNTLSIRLEDTNARVVETLDALDTAINPTISELERLREHLSSQWSF